MQGMRAFLCFSHSFPRIREQPKRKDFIQDFNSLRDNCHTRATGSTTLLREGTVLPQGIALCGVSGKHMTVYCHLRNGGLVPWYRYSRRPMRWHGDRCREIPGAIIDESIRRLRYINLVQAAVKQEGASI